VPLDSLARGLIGLAAGKSSRAAAIPFAHRWSPREAWTNERERDVSSETISQVSSVRLDDEFERLRDGWSRTAAG
jgi:hypothetical protein